MVSGSVPLTSAEAKPGVSGAREFKTLEVPVAAECLRLLGVRGLTYELTRTVEAGHLARATHDEPEALRGQGGLP